VAALKQINHPNICACFAFYHEEAMAYLVIEYLPGGTLTEWMLRQHPPPSEGRMREVLIS
jgi:serine/threonine protein kinase